MSFSRSVQIWGPGYVKERLRRMAQRPTHPLRRIWVMIADHFEPKWLQPDRKTAQSRVALWQSALPRIAQRCKQDSAGNQPRYTFFYPQEEYEPSLMEPLAEMTRTGIADVEVHIHHDGEGRQNFIDRITGFCEVLQDRHGLLRERDGKVTFGFVHGNWALDNSSSDGRWCGLNGEILLLRDLGCYADFTMPSGDSSTQAQQVNTIYFCKGDAHLPKSYNRGTPVRCGDEVKGDLMMIPGPLGIRWRDRLLPRLETGELAGNNLATPYRVRRWLDLSPRLEGDVFIKLFTHGAQEQNTSYLLSGGLESAFNMLVEEAGRKDCQLYFVSAWQMYQAIDAIRQRRNPLLEVQATVPVETSVSI